MWTTRTLVIIALAVGLSAPALAAVHFVDSSQALLANALGAGSGGDVRDDRDYGDARMRDDAPMTRTEMPRDRMRAPSMEDDAPRMARDQTTRDPMARDQTTRDPMARDPMARDVMARDPHESGRVTQAAMHQARHPWNATDVEVDRYMRSGGRMADASTTGENDTWPHDGSYATYTARSARQMGRGAILDTHVNATWTYTGGQWWLSCDMSYDTPSGMRSGDTTRWTSGGTTRGGAVSPRSTDAPLIGVSSSSFFARGGMTAWRLSGCELDTFRVSLQQEGDVSHGVSSGGFFGGGGDMMASWDTTTGLLLSWDAAGRNSLDQGELVDTDAPMMER